MKYGSFYKTLVDYLREEGYTFQEKMDDFSTQLWMIKCLAWVLACHFAGNKLEAPNQMFQAK